MTVSVVYKIQSQDRRSKLAESITATIAQASDIQQALEIVVVAQPELDIPEQDIDTVLRTRHDALTVGRNLGADAATGDIIAFMDDDAYPRNDWLKRIMTGIEHADMAGGPLYPEYRASSPQWLPRGWHWLIGCGPYYDTAQLVPNTYGSNFAITREAFTAVGGFDETIGAGSNSVQQGAETNLATRVRNAGYTGVWYDPHAIVYHIISNTPSPYALHKRAFQQGLAKAAIGTGDRETKFLREELTELGHRPLKTIPATASLTAAVGGGYVMGKYQ